MRTSLVIAPSAPELVTVRAEAFAIHHFQEVAVVWALHGLDVVWVHDGDYARA
jgi:hypothetical protein